MTNNEARFKNPRLGRPVIGYIAVVLLVVLGAVAVIPLLLGADPYAQDLHNPLQPPAFAGGSYAHLLGTDNLGRDVLARLSVGIRSSFSVAFVGLIIAMMLGILVGVVAGYLSGRVDNALMRLVDIELSIPPILFLLMIAAVLNPGFLAVSFALGMVGWIVFARIARAQVLSLREHEMVMAIRSLGARHVWIMFRHILPNIGGPLIVVAALQLAIMIIAEASLGFLGMGVPPPTPTLGSMIATGQGQMLGGGWWLVVIPGLSIAVLITAINIVGDVLRDRLDPTHRV